MECSECGKIIRDPDAEECPECGKPLDDFEDRADEEDDFEDDEDDLSDIFEDDEDDEEEDEAWEWDGMTCQCCGVYLGADNTREQCGPCERREQGTVFDDEEDG